MRVVELELRDGQLVDVPADGATMGEIVMRGNNVMKGYYRDPEATAKAFAGGWFHSGDLGVMHPDGYVELRDRAKDVVISGGENISTVEVEQAVLAHDAVLDVAVIGVPDEKWGERPKAFVVLKAGATTTEDELLDHVRARIARYKAPREIEFVDELPKTSTGKTQKFALREKEWVGRDVAHQGLKSGRARPDLLHLDGGVVGGRRRVPRAGPPRPALQVVRELREQQAHRDVDHRDHQRHLQDR